MLDLLKLPVRGVFNNASAQSSIECFLSERKRSRRCLQALVIQVDSCIARKSKMATKSKMAFREVQCTQKGAQWLSGRVLDSRPRGRWFEPHQCHCVVSLSKNINPSLVLVQPRKTRPFLTEKLLMGRKKSNQTNKANNASNIFRFDFRNDGVCFFVWIYEMEQFKLKVHVRMCFALISNQSGHLICLLLGAAIFFY